MVYGKVFQQYEQKDIQSNPTRVFLAFAEHKNSHRAYLWWEPINCYKDGDDFCHVNIRDDWMCRECGQMNYDKFIMPMKEHDALFYVGTDNKYPLISSLFKKKKCGGKMKDIVKRYIEGLERAYYNNCGKEKWDELVNVKVGASGANMFRRICYKSTRGKRIF